MKATASLVTAGLLWLLRAGGLGAGVTVWELPQGGARAPGNREGWRPVERSGRLEHGAAVENDRLTVLVAQGTTGPTVAAKGTSSLPVEVTVSTAGAGGTGVPPVAGEMPAPPGSVGGVRLAKLDGAEAVLGFVAGGAEVELALRVGAAHVEFRPGRNAHSLTARASARYAIVPDFAGHDSLYDPTRHAADARPVPAENLLVQLLDGEQAILLLLWKGAADAKPQEGTATAPRQRRGVGLLAAGEGASRRFTASHIEFLGKPVCVALLAGEGLWHAADLCELPGAKTVRTGWTRPFEARWRADLTLEGYDAGNVAAFLKLAAQLGLSKGRERDWERAYAPTGSRAAGSSRLLTETCNFRLPDKSGELPRFRPSGAEADEVLWPCVFREKETLLTLPAEWPCYPDPTKGLLDPVQKQRAAEGKEPLQPLHPYGRAIIYPIDRTQKTPLAAYTVVDVMRDALGTGPCDWDWLERSR